MKVALITDIHFGVRNFNKSLLENQLLFFEKVFFPTIKEKEIKLVVNLGDIFDNRKSIDFDILNRIYTEYFDKLEFAGIQQINIIGNHDCYYKNTNRINSPDLLLSHYKNQTNVIENPLELPEMGMAFIPWLSPENYEFCVEYIQKKEQPILMGHFQISGFRMYQGNYSENGLNASLFNGYEKVFSGHFHARSNQGNIHYLGNPFHTRWSETDEQKGFHLFDLETLELEFIPNPYSLFNKLEYTDDMDIPDELKGTYVKLFVNEQYTPDRLNAVCSRINEQNPLSLQIVNNHDYYGLESAEQEASLIESLKSEDMDWIIKDYVETRLKLPEEDKNFSRGYLLDLHKRATE